MRITKKLKDQVKKAEKLGHNCVVLTKARKWNTDAVIVVDFDAIINEQVGTNYDTPKWGEWQTKEWECNHRDCNSIKFRSLYQL